MNKQRIEELKELCWEPRQYGPPWFNANKFAEHIIRGCVAECERVATDARATVESKSVTDAGRVLHEGVWGGAKNCSGRIKEYFGVE